MGACSLAIGVDRVIEIEVIVVGPYHGMVHIVRVDGQAQATLNKCFRL